MATNNPNVPTAVSTNRTYAQTIKENLQNGWEKIKTNPYVNMFFPVSDVAEGNTLAVATAIIPGKQPVTTAVKTLSKSMTAEEIVKQLRGLGPSIGGDAFYKDLAQKMTKAFPPKARKQLGNLYKRLKVDDVIPTPDGKYLQWGHVLTGPDSDTWRFVVRDKAPVGVLPIPTYKNVQWVDDAPAPSTVEIPRPVYTPEYDANGIEILPFKQGGILNYFNFFK